MYWWNPTTSQQGIRHAPSHLCSSPTSAQTLQSLPCQPFQQLEEAEPQNTIYRRELGSHGPSDMDPVPTRRKQKNRNKILRDKEIESKI